MNDHQESNSTVWQSCKALMTSYLMIATSRLANEGLLNPMGAMGIDLSVLATNLRHLPIAHP